MAPILYDYCKMPMDDTCKEDGDKCCKLAVGILGLLVIVLLGVPLIFFIIKANSEACQDGLRAVMECRNVTYLLQQELAEAQRGFRDAEAQAVTCNQTVVSTSAPLDGLVLGGREDNNLSPEIWHRVGLQGDAREVPKLFLGPHVKGPRFPYQSMGASNPVQNTGVGAGC